MKLEEVYYIHELGEGNPTDELYATPEACASAIRKYVNPKLTVREAVEIARDCMEFKDVLGNDCFVNKRAVRY